GYLHGDIPSAFRLPVGVWNVGAFRTPFLCTIANPCAIEESSLRAECRSPSLRMGMVRPQRKSSVNLQESRGFFCGWQSLYVWDFRTSVGSHLGARGRRKESLPFIRECRFEVSNRHPNRVQDR